MMIWKTLAFGFVMLVYLWFPYQMISGYQTILEEGTLYRFRSQPVDPYDAFRGRYITLSYPLPNFKFTDANTLWKQGESIFAELSVDGQGYATITNIYKKKPDHSQYILANVLYVAGDEVYIELPENMWRYYMNEELAPLAEKAYLELSIQNPEMPDTVNVYVDVRVLDGRAVLEEVYMKGLPVGEYLQQQIKQ